jgi:hypothetical protein
MSIKEVIYTFVGVFILIQFANAQTNYTINGYVKDAKDGEELIGASIYLKDLKTNGTSTNAYGFYSITLPEGIYTITVQFIGYNAQSLQIILNQNIKQDLFYLKINNYMK